MAGDRKRVGFLADFSRVRSATKIPTKECRIPDPLFLRRKTEPQLPICEEEVSGACLRFRPRLYLADFLWRPDVAEHNVEGKVVADLEDGRAHERDAGSLGDHWQKSHSLTMRTPVRAVSRNAKIWVVPGLAATWDDRRLQPGSCYLYFAAGSWD